MKMSKALSVQAAVFLLSLLVTPGSASAQNLHAIPQADRIHRDADMSARQTLADVAPRWATSANRVSDEVDPATPLRMTIVVRRDPAVQAAFEQLLADQQNPASPRYHHWLQPAEVGSLFGPTQNDVQVLTAWIRSQGLTVDSVAPSRMAIEFSGAPSAVSAAFRTSFHLYRFGGRSRRAPDSEPSVPAAFVSVVQTIHGFTDDEPVPAVHHHSVSRAPAEAQTPQPAYSTSSGNHYMTPGDFDLIYDLKSLPSALTGATIAGTSQHVSIIDTGTVNLSDIADFARLTALGNYTLNVLSPFGATTTISSESTLDVDRVIGTAPGVTADLIVVPTAQGGIYSAASYAVNTLSNPVLTISYDSCEVTGGQSTVNMWNTLWTTAASQGISVFVSSGDSGADTCDTHGSAAPSAQALHVNAICSSQYATCVGGTEFAADAAQPTTYWSSANGTGLTSVLSYIPEGAWNDPVSSTGDIVLSTGGGVSIYITKPTWQTGTGVPADGFRDLPDVSFSASAHDGYYGCLNFNCESNQFEYFSGTSAAAPSMAGVAALLNMSAGTRQGNLNSLIYKLANSSAAPVIFHDTTIATSGVSGCTLAIPSLCNNSTPSTNALTGGQPGYLLTPGYDQATGWGSLDVGKFITAAVPVSTTLTLHATYTQITTSQSTTASVTLTPASTSVAAPTGTVQFYSNGVAIGSPVSLANNSATSIPLTFATIGNYQLTAIYSGDTFYTGSTASAATVTVALLPPALTLSSAPGSLTFTSGAISGNLVAATVGSTNSYAGSVALSCTLTGSTAPYPPMCSVTPASVTLAANGTASASVTISSTTLVTSLQPGPRLGNAKSTPAVLTCGLLCLLALRRRWSTRPTLLALMLLAIFAAPIGCGKSGPTVIKGSSAGTYNVTITASGTSNGAPIASTAIATINVVIN